MALNVGDRVGDYEIVGMLGAGGMGRVYKVRNVISDRIEAMKVLLPNLASEPELADRFMREIKVLASFNHPNIAALYTASRIDNQLVMIMEFVDGVSLGDLVKQKEGFELFEAIMQQFETDVVEKVFTVQIARQEDVERMQERRRPQPMQMVMSGGGGPQQASRKPQTVRHEDKVGRNDPCPCGSGKKYKKCHGA